VSTVKSGMDSFLKIVNKNKVIILLGILSSLPLFLVRFLPVFDYPQWLYQASVIKNFAHYSNWYTLNWIPVPNWGSAILLSLFTSILGIELSGKVVLALYAFFLVITFAYLVRGITGRASSFEYIGPLLVYNYFFYNGFLSFTIGIPILLAALGFLSRLSPKPNRREIIILSILSVSAYLCHLVIWIPISVYVLIAVYPLKNHNKSILISQIAPLILLAVYIGTQTGTGGMAIEYYKSFLNKLYSLIGPLLPFHRIDPFEMPVPILFANFVVLSGIAILLLWGIKKSGISKRSYPMVITALILWTVAVITPFTWFGGMLGLDQRLAFLGFVIVISIFSALAQQKQKQVLYLFILAAFILVIHSSIFISVGSQLDKIQKAIYQSHPTTSIYAASFRYPPVYGECKPRFWNAGGGIFPLEWFPLYYAIEQGPLSVHTFGTSILREKSNIIYSVNFGEFQNEKERMRFIREIKQKKDSNFIILFGCQKDISPVESLISPEYQLIGEGKYFEIFKTQK
jgi:hypothetical protein